MARAKACHRRDSWKWYGVRSLYRWVAVGKPKNPDSSYIPGATLVEERIVLVKARSGEEALKKAKQEGMAYVRSIHCINGYGQKVRAHMLKSLEAYELFSLPGPGAEVFSATEEIDVSMPDERICERPIGLGESLSEGDPWRRFKFISGEVIRLMLEHSQNSPSSSSLGNKHGR